MEKILDKLAELIVNRMWKYIEPLLVRSVEEGVKRGINFGYIDGHQDGQCSAIEDLVRRCTFIYDFVRHAAEKDVYLANEKPIEEIPEEEFQAIIKEMEKAEFEAVVDDMGEI